MGGSVQTQPNVGNQTASGALVASLQVTQRQATLVSLLGTNAGPAQHVQLWDTTSSADANAQLLFTFSIPANATFSLDTPLKFRRGILVRNASQRVSANPTADAGAADCWFTTRHI